MITGRDESKPDSDKSSKLSIPFHWSLAYLALVLVQLKALSLPSIQAWLGHFQATMTVLVWCLPAYLVSRHFERDPLEEHAVLTRPRMQGLLLTAAACFLLLPLYTWLVARFILEPSHKWPELATMGSLFVHQLAFVALPEEYFFRGVMQASACKRFGLWPGVVLCAIVFALAHVIAHAQPLALIIVFPGLLFGIIREKSNSILPGVFFHALCNVVAAALSYPL